MSAIRTSAEGMIVETSLNRALYQEVEGFTETIRAMKYSGD